MSIQLYVMFKSVLFCGRSHHQIDSLVNAEKNLRFQEVTFIHYTTTTKKTIKTENKNL